MLTLGFSGRPGKISLTNKVHESTLIIIMKNQTKPDEFLTIEEVAKILKVTKVTLYRMARKGKIPAVKFGKAWRINSKLLEALREGKTI